MQVGRLHHNLHANTTNAFVLPTRLLCLNTNGFMTIKAVVPRGFTLTEMLVVMVAIALMITLLMPSLAMARKNAKLVLCATNQQQIGMAIHSYAADLEGAIPYGPKTEPQSIADFYVVDGMVTSQFSLLNQGQPVGVGLLLHDYLNREREIVFCPDTDQPFDADRELDRFGRTQALSGYFYRHGSNTLESLSQPRETWDDHIWLADLGINRSDETIRALLMDQNFFVERAVPAFNVMTRTNHERLRSNTLFSDGHVETFNNANDRYTANVGTTLHLGPDRILGALEQADEQ